MYQKSKPFRNLNSEVPPVHNEKQSTKKPVKGCEYTECLQGLTTKKEGSIIGVNTIDTYTSLNYLFDFATYLESILETRSPNATLKSIERSFRKKVDF